MNIPRTAARPPRLCGLLVLAAGETEMAFGKRRGGADFLPILKYDARNGSFYLQDRVNRDGMWETEQTDVTTGLRGIFDLETVEVGWIKFPKGAAPELQMVPAGEDMGEAPSKDHREGFRLLVKMDSDFGGDVREFMSTAAAAWNGLDALHTAFLNDSVKHPNELPVVKLTSIVEKKTATGASFTPMFEIVDWVPRPDDMPKQSRISTNGQRPLKQTPAGIEDEIPF
jgi:hypothetical protein